MVARDVDEDRADARTVDPQKWPDSIRAAQVKPGTVALLFVVPFAILVVAIWIHCGFKGV